MNPYRYLSDEIEILLGEHLAYSAINHYYHFTHPEFFPDFKDGDMTQKEMFENVFFEREYDANLTNSAYLFDQVGISFSGKMGSCKYEQIRQIICQNIKNLKGSFLVHFGAACTKSEKDYFTIEQGCKPLFEQFVTEGYCTYLNNRFYWTVKIRPILEVLGFWESKKSPTKNERILASLSPGLIKQLNYYAATDQLIMAIKTLRESKQLGLSASKFFLEEFMFPETWGKKREPILVTWHGPEAIT